MTLLNFEIAWRISFFVIMAYENSLQGVLQGIFKPDTPPQDKLHGMWISKTACRTSCVITCKSVVRVPDFLTVCM
jgi:hypothetical protein